MVTQGGRIYPYHYRILQVKSNVSILNLPFIADVQIIAVDCTSEEPEIRGSLGDINSELLNRSNLAVAVHKVRAKGNSMLSVVATRKRIFILPIYVYCKWYHKWRSFMYKIS